MTFAAFTFLILLITPVPQASAYCWEPGKNPKFTGPPKVEQVNVRKVRVSWFGLVEMRDCADQFLVKYWPSSSPSNYMTTTLVNNDVNAIDVEVTPFVPYEFQAVAREDKGLIGGIDWNKSDKTEFKTSKQNNEVSESKPNVIPTQDTLPKDSSNLVSNNVHNNVEQVFKEETNLETVGNMLSLELICIIAVCSLVLILIFIGIVYKLACAKKSSDELDDEEDEEDSDDESAEKEKLEV